MNARTLTRPDFLPATMEPWRLNAIVFLVAFGLSLFYDVLVAGGTDVVLFAFGLLAIADLVTAGMGRYHTYREVRAFRRELDGRER